MKKSIAFVIWITQNTHPMTCNQVYYNEVFYFTDGKNHTDRKDLKELYQIFFQLEGLK